MRGVKQLDRYLAKQDAFTVRYYTRICEAAINEAFYSHPEWQRAANPKDISRVIHVIRRDYSPFGDADEISRLAEIIWEYSLDQVKQNLKTSNLGHLTSMQC